MISIQSTKLQTSFLANLERFLLKNVLTYVCMLRYFLKEIVQPWLKTEVLLQV